MIFHRAIALLVSLSVLAVSQAFARSPYDPIRTFDQLKTSLEHEQFQSMQALLSQLSPELRKRFSLSYATDGPIGASLEWPSVTLYSPDASLMISFAGSPDMPGGNRVEVLEFKRPEHVLRSMEIEFPSQKGSEVRWKYRPAVEGNVHGEAKVYGALPSALIQSNPLTVKSYKSTVADAFKAFMTRSIHSHYRYKILKDCDTITLDRLSAMNQEIGDSIARRNVERAIGALRRSPDYTKYANAIDESLTKSSEKSFIESLPLSDRKLYLKARESLATDYKDKRAARLAFVMDQMGVSRSYLNFGKDPTLGVARKSQIGLGYARKFLEEVPLFHSVQVAGACAIEAVRKIQSLAPARAN